MNEKKEGFGVPGVAKNLVEMLHRNPETVVLSWEGSRVPEELTLPNGVKVKIGYMRDGHIQLIPEGGKVKEALYERVIDDPEMPAQSIRLTYDKADFEE